jgi:hypothetical protein
MPFALPEEEPERNRMLETALNKGMIFHFVNEGLSLTSAEDLKTIQHYRVLQVRQVAAADWAAAVRP